MIRSASSDRSRDVRFHGQNYLGVKDLCAVMSHNAGGYAFYKSAEHHRITRFGQWDSVDRPGHYVYLRDDDTGVLVVSWQPVGKKPGGGEVRVQARAVVFQVFVRLQGIEASRRCSSALKTTLSCGCEAAQHDEAASG